MSRMLPLIKEYRVNDILVNSLVCFDQYLYDRLRQRECVLKLYKTNKIKSLDHWDKSIFRGMVIPSLKYLGLLYGEKDSLAISANGKLLIESKKNDILLYKKALLCIIYELDNQIFQFLKMFIKKEYYFKKDFIEIMKNDIHGASEKQVVERINKWLSILNQVGLINMGNWVRLNVNNYDITLKISNYKNKSTNRFIKYLLTTYRILAQDMAGIVSIESLRKIICVEFLKQNQVVTENQFDDMLRSIPFESDSYQISLGKPMGAKEKLFKYKDSFYNTIYIKNIKK